MPNESTFDIAMFAEPKVETPKAVEPDSGERSYVKRTSRRIQVPGTLVACATKSFLGIWKVNGVPYQVCDIAINGLSFRNFGTGFDPGTSLRMNILLPKALPVSVTGEVIWNQLMPNGKGAVSGVNAHICGVQFKSYTNEAWSALTKLIEAPPEQAAAPIMEEQLQRPQLSILG